MAARTRASRAQCRPSKLSYKRSQGAERWPSGRRRTPAKGVRVNALRGFESLSLRQINYLCLIQVRTEISGTEIYDQPDKCGSSMTPPGARMPVRHVELMRKYSTSACCEPVNLPVAAGTGGARALVANSPA